MVKVKCKCAASVRVKTVKQLISWLNTHNVHCGETMELSGDLKRKDDLVEAREEARLRYRERKENRL